MEKYTVDLEKVLDDFEYNEEKMKENAHTRNIPVSDVYEYPYQNCHRQQYKTPASNYRKPHFDPINLSDADFARSTKMPFVVTRTNNIYHPTIITDPYNVCTNVIDSSTGIYNQDTLFRITSNNAKIGPDVIGSNCINYNESDKEKKKRCLPDIASTNIEVSKLNTKFDLICSNSLAESEKMSIQNESERALIEESKTASVQNELDNALVYKESENIAVEDEDSENAVVHKELERTLIKKELERIPMEENGVVKFDNIDVTESELHSYLHELEEAQNPFNEYVNKTANEEASDNVDHTKAEVSTTDLDHSNVSVSLKDIAHINCLPREQENSENETNNAQSLTDFNQNMQANFCHPPEYQNNSSNSLPVESFCDNNGLKINETCDKSVSEDKFSDPSIEVNHETKILNKPFTNEYVDKTKTYDKLNESHNHEKVGDISIQVKNVQYEKNPSYRYSIEADVSTTTMNNSNIVNLDSNNELVLSDSDISKSHNLANDLDTTSLELGCEEDKVNICDTNIDSGTNIESMGNNLDVSSFSDICNNSDYMLNDSDCRTESKTINATLESDESVTSENPSSIAEHTENESDPSDGKINFVPSRANKIFQEATDPGMDTKLQGVGHSPNFYVNSLDCHVSQHHTENFTSCGVKTSENDENSNQIRVVEDLKNDKVDHDHDKIKDPMVDIIECADENNCENNEMFETCNDKKTEGILSEKSALIESTRSDEKVQNVINQTNIDDSISIGSNSNELNNNLVVTENFSGDENSNASIETSDEYYPHSSSTLPLQFTDLKPPRPTSLQIRPNVQSDDFSSTSAGSGRVEEQLLGKQPPFWVPDSEAPICMQCGVKFTVIKRRHHCRGCGQVLCSKCCDMKARLEYMNLAEARVCHCCYKNLENALDLNRRPNPNNPMEYCSTISPLLQVGPLHQPPPSVLVPVPVGVLKREGKPKTSDVPKKVMFSDGIRPGGDLTELDLPKPRVVTRQLIRAAKRIGTPPGNALYARLINPETKSFIPPGNELPPIITKTKGEWVYSELIKPIVSEELALKFSINPNLFLHVSKFFLDCCINREVWCMSSEGLSCVGQDEVVFIFEALDDEKYPPKDIFFIINTLYQDATAGTTITELTYLPSFSNYLLGSKEHGGFIFVRPTFQCTQKLPLPKPPFLIGLLIHRWESPWARLFPIRLILRLGAEYRYYPCPLFSVRFRQPLFSDIGHTIISLLADFRKYTFSLPTVQGLVIHMEDRFTTILLPRNRYDQVLRALKNSDENVLTLAGNISTIADSHLVCIQSTEGDCSYQTQAINIHNKPRKVTGSSFVVFNGSLKQCGWSGKSNIIEDGLMVQIPNESMAALRGALNQMKDYTIGCGPQAEEVVMLKWCEDDTNFNIGVTSCIDGKPLNGIPSIRVHNGINYNDTSRFIRWTEVFIIQADEESSNRNGDTVNIKRMSESIARATCRALLPYLDLLATANLTILSVRTTIDLDNDNVGYEAGSGGEKLPPLYMKSLDEELIMVVNEAAVSLQNASIPVVLELIFRIMEQD